MATDMTFSGTPEEKLTWAFKVSDWGKPNGIVAVKSPYVLDV